MFEGYLIGRREKTLGESGETVFNLPAIALSMSQDLYLRDHSQRLPYNSPTLDADIEVFFVRVADDQVATLRNDPDTYLMDVDFTPVDLIPFANWLKAKGQTRGTFDPQVARYQQTRPEFIAAMQAVRDLLDQQ